MDIRVLQYFLVVAQEESISRAAKILNMTQPPLSRQLHDLEEELGHQLFVRGARKITLTEEGLLLRHRAEELVELLEKTKSEICSSNQAIRGDIYIGGGETDGMRLVAKAVRQLQKEHPNIHCHLFTGNSEDVADRLDRGLLDFGIMIAPTEKKKYDFIPLPVTDAWGLLMRKDSPLALRDGIRPKDLLGKPIIVPRQIITNRELVGWIPKGARALNIVSTYNLLFNAALLVEEGVGYALGIDKISVESINDHLCFRLLTPQVQVGFDLVWKKDRFFSKAAELFLESIRQQSLENNG